MQLQEIVLIGAGGMACEVLDIFDAINNIKLTYEVIGYIVEPGYGVPGTYINEKPILGGFEWLEKNKADLKAICAVGAPELRMRLVKKAANLGVSFCTVIHPSAFFTRWVTIGEGSVITAGCILTNHILIGNHVIIDLACTIGHDTVIEDFAFLAPGVHVSGKCKLGEGCYIGTGANIIEKKNIGSWSVVGAGSTIIIDIPKNATVVGVTGKVIKYKPDGWHMI